MESIVPPNSSWWRDLQRTFLLYLALAVGVIPLGIVEGLLLLNGVTSLVVHAVVLTLGFGAAFTLWTRFTARPQVPPPRSRAPRAVSADIIIYQTARWVSGAPGILYLEMKSVHPAPSRKSAPLLLAPTATIAASSAPPTRPVVLAN